MLKRIGRTPSGGLACLGLVQLGIATHLDESRSPGCEEVPSEKHAKQIHLEKLVIYIYMLKASMNASTRMPFVPQGPHLAEENATRARGCR